MSEPVIEPRQAESQAVQLTRMEGKIDGVAEKVSDLRVEVTEHRMQIHALQSAAQQLESDARSAARALVDADKGREDTAAALKDADAARVAAAKEKVDQSTQNWTPWQRLGAFAVGFAVVAGSIVAAIALMPTSLGH